MVDVVVLLSFAGKRLKQGLDPCLRSLGVLLASSTTDSHGADYLAIDYYRHSASERRGLASAGLRRILQAKAQEHVGLAFQRLWPGLAPACCSGNGFRHRRSHAYGACS